MNFSKNVHNKNSKVIVSLHPGMQQVLAVACTTSFTFIRRNFKRKRRTESKRYSKKLRINRQFAKKVR